MASCGKFGERWAELSDAYGGDTVHWETEWGQKIDPAELDRVMGENPDVEVVFTTLSETSTGENSATTFASWARWPTATAP